jgi:hypothetical protein
MFMNRLKNMLSCLYYSPNWLDGLVPGSLRAEATQREARNINMESLIVHCCFVVSLVYRSVL